MNTDEQAFLTMIHDNPDEDTPRLVYADWLQEHGDEVRAELIRVQCQIASNPEWDCLVCNKTGIIQHSDIYEGTSSSICDCIWGHESAILTQHRDRLYPVCPVCNGIGIRPNHWGDGKCPHCPSVKVGNVLVSGHVGIYARGFLYSVSVPTIGTVFHQYANDATARAITPWASALFTTHPCVRRMSVADRRPLEGRAAAIGTKTEMSYDWWRETNVYDASLHSWVIPAFLFNVLATKYPDRVASGFGDGVHYFESKTPESAIDTLAETMVSVARRML